MYFQQCTCVVKVKDGILKEDVVGTSLHTLSVDDVELATAYSEALQELMLEQIFIPAAMKVSGGHSSQTLSVVRLGLQRKSILIFPTF